MFSESTQELLSAINDLITKLRTMASAMSEVIRKSLDSVYSVCWDDPKNKSGAVVDPAYHQKVQDCRDSLLPKLNELRKIQDEAMTALGIEREEMELDIVAHDTWEQKMDKNLEEAKKSGDFFDLCDSDEELDVQPKPGAAGGLYSGVKVKAEPRVATASRPGTGTSSYRYARRRSPDSDLEAGSRYRCASPDWDLDY
jgi:hypothetical protein